MWFLNLIPDFVVHVIAILGVLLTVGAIAFGQIPFVGTYNIPINIVGAVLIALGFYFEGAIGDNNSWKLKADELQVKLAQAQVVSEQTNTILVQTILEKDNVIKDKQNEIDKAIKKYVTDECRLSNAAVSLFNSSSQGELPDSSISSITGTSEFKVADLLETVNDNNATYYKLAEQVKGWQEWYYKNKKIFDGVQ